MKYLKKFTTTEEYSSYTADTNNFYAPNVSFINRGNKVEYHQYVPHDYVEIGGVKWATMNIGAESVTDYGLYFQWGDTAGYTSGQCGNSSTAYKKPFAWADCVLHNGTSNSGATTFTKYNGNDGKTVLEPCDDAATLYWGGNWRMPTAVEFQALEGAVNSAWTESYNGSGVAGLVLTDKTDSSKVLFFPATGCLYNGRFINNGSYGYCWTNSLYYSDVSHVHLMGFHSSTVEWLTQNVRSFGFSIRPVLGA